jgi:hypothetical protein
VRPTAGTQRRVALRVEHGRQQAQPGHAGGHRFDGALFDLGDRGERRAVEAEHGMEVRPERVGVTQDHFTPELREIDAEVHRQQRLADASAAATDGDHTPHPSRASFEGRWGQRGGHAARGYVREVAHRSVSAGVVR